MYGESGSVIGTPLHSPPDVLVNNVGTLFTFCPLTLRAKEWIDEHVQDDAQWFGHASNSMPISTSSCPTLSYSRLSM